MGTDSGSGMEKRILGRGGESRYEEAAEALEEVLTPFAFFAAIEREFGDHKLEGRKLTGQVLHVLKLTSGPVITTNFDRVLDKYGAGKDSDVIAAIDEAIRLKNSYNIRVINLSLGRPVFESYKIDPLCQAVEAAWKAGIVVVVAAGNEGRNNSAGTSGYGTIAAPGNDPYAIMWTPMQSHVARRQTHVSGASRTCD